MTLLALRAFVARIPGIVWIIVGTAAALAVAIWATYRSGEHAGERVVHRAALADSVHVAQRTVDAKTAITRARVVMATRHRAKADTARATFLKSHDDYATARAGIDSLLGTAPPAIVAYVAQADATIGRAVTAVAQADTAMRVDSTGFDAFADERKARTVADTLESHAAKDPDPTPDGGHAFPVRVVLATTAAVLVILHFVR